MRLREIVVALFFLGLPAAAQGQYVGAQRAMPRAEALDSLAAAAGRDSILAADRIGRDYYRAGANVHIATHGSPGDSATISASGGTGAPCDTVLYDYILCWLGKNDHLVPDYSGKMVLSGGAADSASGDSLYSAIDQLKNTGGVILITAGDTIRDFAGSAYDSLPTPGGITRTVVVRGQGRDRSVLAGKSAAGTLTFYWTLNRGAGQNGAELVFEDLTIAYPAAAYSNLSWRSGNLAFRNCVLSGDIVNLGPLPGSVAENSRNLVIQNCELRNSRLYLIGSVFRVQLTGSCGALADWRMRGHSSTDSSRYEITGGSYTVSSIEGYPGYQSVHSWNGVHIRFTGGTYPYYNYGRAYFNGCTIEGPVGSTASNYLAFKGFASVSGCTFWRAGIYADHAGAAIQGNSFWYSSTGVVTNADGVAVKANAFNYCTTGVNGASASNTRLQTNTFYNCATATSGSFATDTDNVSW